MAAPRVSFQIVGVREGSRILRRLSPKQNPRPIRRALIKLGFIAQRHSARRAILPGGTRPPHPTKLTSRTGTGRRSIGVDRRPLAQFAIDVGSDLFYMRLHALGLGRFPVRDWLTPGLREARRDGANVIAREWRRAAVG